MFTRIVKMTFQPEAIDTFIAHFESVKDRVRNQPGCRKVVLFQDKTQKNVFFTYSIWESETDLERYRHSGFFKEVWTTTKALFAAKPEAWSVNTLIEMD